MLLSAYASSAREFIHTIAGHRRLLAHLIKRELSDEYVTDHLSVGWTLHPPAVPDAGLPLCLYECFCRSRERASEHRDQRRSLSSVCH
jgi:hypothetical protein